MFRVTTKADIGLDSLSTLLVIHFWLYFANTLYPLNVDAVVKTKNARVL
jgi:hypothetical protein